MERQVGFLAAAGRISRALADFRPLEWYREPIFTLSKSVPQRLKPHSMHSCVRAKARTLHGSDGERDTADPPLGLASVGMTRCRIAIPAGIS